MNNFTELRKDRPGMLTVEEALDKILSFVTALDAEEKPILDCLGQILTDDIYASFDIPLNDNTAMDGYAIQAASITGASLEHPKVLKVIGELPAGSITDLKVEFGTAIRIMTGASIPKGADAVVPFEDTDEEKRKGTAEIGVLKEIKAGDNIRCGGEDIAKGALVIKKGKLISPADIGVLASLGRNKVSVIRRPVIGIMATGNEVLELDKPLDAGKIYNSNSYSLAAQVIKYGGIPKLLGVAMDSIEQLTSALHRGLDCDMLITSGGVSMGDFDMVKEVLTVEGNISFWAVRMKPGKPLAFGSFKRENGIKVAHLGLPGNPVSSMVTFEIFGRPAIYKMMGRTDWVRPMVRAIMEDHVSNKDGRRVYARVIVTRRNGQYYARLTGEQGSGILTSMMKANALAIVPETTSEVRPGSFIDVVILD
ncbi:gephyrin-like molybdotransferase Glp [Chloroflexota bacterium]